MPILHPAFRLFAFFALAISSLLITGCNGCRDDGAEDQLTQEEKDKKEKEKKKPDFETRSPVLLPGWYEREKTKRKSDDDEPAPDVVAAMNELTNPAIRYNRAKLGHWFEAHMPAIANNYNADGQLTSFSATPSGQPLSVPSTDYFLTTTRPASLAKGEWKNLETSVFLPRRDMKTQIANVIYAMDRGTGGIPYINIGQPTTLLKPFQYHIVLLSDRPDTYNFFKLTDSVQLRNQRLGNGDLVPPFYYIVPSNVGDPIPLPRQSLNWTTIAYLIWDDFDPDNLSSDHQAALVDWLHYGGQLILSGPDCLDKLQNSFLGEYLPAQFDGSRNITNADLVELNKNWSVRSQRNAAEKREFQISDKVPLLGVKFNPHQSANYVDGTGELAIERIVGRGRIVISSISLSSPALRKWPSFPSFVNNVLLRRPARQFGKSFAGDVSFGWEDDGTTIFDPLVGSTLRFIARDLSPTGTPTTPAYSITEESDNQPAAFSMQFPDSVDLNELRINRTKNVPVRSKTNDRFFGGYMDSPQSGVAGWNDDSGISLAARETLKEAAGITPPSSKFVLKMLAAYLAVLVPLNWLVFRLIGRVEWAWIAAPIIAIVGAVMVVKMAALDIGFVRSNTQIGLLEVHANYPRAHATEYSALYTSLSTRYNVDLDNPSAQSLPFAKDNESKFLKPNEGLSQVRMKRTVASRLEGFQIRSNSTGMLHTEYMLDLEGNIYPSLSESDKPTLINNGSVLNLQHAGVVRRTPDGEYEIAWIGELAAASASPNLKFEPTTADDYAERWHGNPLFVSTSRVADALWDRHIGSEKLTTSLDQLATIPDLEPNWNAINSMLMPYANTNTNMQTNVLSGEITRDQFRFAFGSITANANIKVGRLFDTVADNLQLAPGESRLIAVTDQRLGQTNFDPKATQTDQQTLVVVHLQRPPLRPAKRDFNTMTDFTGKSDLDWEREMEESDALFGE